MSLSGPLSGALLSLGKGEGEAQEIPSLPSPNMPPVGGITSPADGATITAIPVTVEASLSDSDGAVIQARLFENGGPAGTDVSAPWAWTAWTPTNGVKTLSVEMTDNLFEVAFTPSITVTIAVPSPPVEPSVSLTSPTDGGTSTAVPITLSASATANSPATSITQVDFLLNGVSVGVDTVAPYSIDVSPANGVYSVTARATDNLGVTKLSNPRSHTVAVTPPPPPPPPPSVTIPTIGSFTINDMTPVEDTQTVTFSWTNSGSAATTTLLDVDGGGTDYTLTSETSQTHVYTTPGTFTASLSLTNSAGSDTETIPAIVVSVAGTDRLITIVTVTENGTGGAKTNETVEFGLPLSPTALQTGESIKVVDDDGSGGVGSELANYQWDLEAQDNSGAKRLGKVTAIVPALGSSATRKLRVYASTDPQPSGTAITIADIQALAGYSNGLCKFTANIGGTSYTLSIKDLFDSGSTTWSKTGLNIAADLIRSGPTCTEWRIHGGARSGGVAHNSGNGLWCEFHVAAYKAGTAAVSGGNPITHIRVDVKRKNGAVDRASIDASHYYYGSLIERATSLSDATMISSDYTDPLLGKQRYSYPRSQPASTITLEAKHVGVFQRVVKFDTQTANFTVGQYLTGSTSGVLGKITQIYDSGTAGTLTLGETNEPFSPTVGETITDPLGGSAILRNNNNGWWPYYNTAAEGARYLTATRSSGVWATDVLGSIITAGAGGKAVVGERISDTVVRLWIFEAFTGYTYASGDWTLEGVGHYYNTRHHDRVRIGTAPTNIALWGDHTVSAGSATDPKTRAAMDYLDVTEMTPPYAASWASSAQTVVNEDLMKGDGAIRPGTVRGMSGGYPNYLGGIYQYIGGTGSRPDIGTLPVWQVAGIIRPDSNGLRKIFENAKHWMLYHHAHGEVHTTVPTNGSRGVPPRSDGGTAYGAEVTIQKPAHWATAGIGVPGIFDTDVAHHPAGPYIPYLMTGDYIWMQELHAQATHTEWGSCTTYQGTGHTKTPWGHATAPQTSGPYVFPVEQTRAAAWRMRDRVVSAAVTPAANKPSLYHPKSYEVARLAMNKQACNSTRGLQAPYFVGTDTVFMNRFQWTTLDPGLLLRIDGVWQISFAFQAWAFLDYCGFGDADSDAMVNFLGRPVIGNPNPDVVNDLWTTHYFFIWNKIPPSETFPANEAELYKWGCHLGPVNTSGWGFSRPYPYSPALTGTLTISDPSVGAGRTFTFSNTYFTGGGTGSGAWYVDGYIRSDAGGLAKITSVTSSTEVICQIITAFASSTPAMSTVKIPGPHPSDYDGAQSALNGSTTFQIQNIVNMGRVLTRWGHDKSAMIATQTARLNYVETQLNNHLKVRA